MQYVHLKSCGGSNPATLQGHKIKKGQLLGCYARVGSTDTPHLHIGFVQRDVNGNRLDVTQINNLCKPEDVYLNPYRPASGYGFDQFAIGLRILPIRFSLPEWLRFGSRYTVQAIDGTDWEDALP